MPVKNGINMMDVKVRNRRSILELVCRARKIPRKEIASILGLTPAAITLITNDLIQEGILVETEKRESGSRGRREVLLELNYKAFYVIGVNITRNHYEVTATDLSAKILYQNRFLSTDCQHDAEKIFTAILDRIRSDLLASPVFKKRRLLTVGISTLGIVNTDTGESLNSYGVFHGRVNIGDFFENALHVPAIVTNNICADAHAEAFLKNSSFQTGRLLFVKYGPGIGSALLTSRDYFNIYDYEAIQLAHVISDPNGKPCICGNHGCLETIVSYENVISELAPLINEENAPELYRAWQMENPGFRNRETSYEEEMESVFESYDHGNPIVSSEMRRVLFHMGTSLKNAITLLNPDSVILYGQAFEHRRFRTAMMQELAAYTRAQRVSFSEYNMKLETYGPATTAISAFFLRGGK